MITYKGYDALDRMREDASAGKKPDKRARNEDGLTELAQKEVDLAYKNMCEGDRRYETIMWGMVSGSISISLYACKWLVDSGKIELRKLWPLAGIIFIFIVWRDDCDVPMLFAPEQHWAIVNAKTLVEDNPGEVAFRTRLIKEATRAFAYVCGSGGSNGGGDLMDAKDVKALDDVQAELPFDIQARFETHLRDMGITPWEETTYLRACQEGWAPPPTNDVQRAIWEKVHQIPDKPIKIEFDPKKDK